MLPFRSACLHQCTNLASGTPALALLHLIKAYRPSAAQSVTVGVLGFPNVGKSGLVNTLKWAKVRHRVFLGRIFFFFSIFGDGCIVVVKVFAVAA
jgi:hypothetical protein